MILDTNSGEGVGAATNLIKFKVYCDKTRQYNSLTLAVAPPSLPFGIFSGKSTCPPSEGMDYKQATREVTVHLYGELHAEVTFGSGILTHSILRVPTASCTQAPFLCGAEHPLLANGAFRIRNIY